MADDAHTIVGTNTAEVVEKPQAVDAQQAVTTQNIEDDGRQARNVQTEPQQAIEITEHIEAAIVTEQAEVSEHPEATTVTEQQAVEVAKQVVAEQTAEATEHPEATTATEQQAVEVVEQVVAAPVAEQTAEATEHPEVTTNKQIGAPVPHVTQPVPVQNQNLSAASKSVSENDRSGYGMKSGMPPASPQPEQMLDSQTQQVLYSAREAFWNGSVDKAESLYKSLISKGNTSPDIYGELGNVYYANGKLEDAATMYYEAGVRLSELQLFGPAMHMVSILKGLKSDKAALLEQTVTGAVWPAQ